MVKVFNPPPNWPQPPRHWLPPQDWRPDPAWPAPPPGWQLWIDTDSPAAPAQSNAPVGKRIFISYRRGDCQPQANAISDGLRHRLSTARIFMDIDSIPAGVNFEEHIRQEIEICDVVLVLIGDDWLSIRGPDGARRIDDPNDYVRVEIEAALSSPRVSPVPVLVEGATMPLAAELPESLAGLCKINAIEMSDVRWSTDIDRLATAIRDLEAQQQAIAQRRLAAEAPSQLLATPQVSGTMRPADEQLTSPALAPPVQWTPPARAPGGDGWVGWVMVAVPIVTCGFLGFVPSIWVAIQRKDDAKLMWRAIARGGAFLAVVVAYLILAGTAPKNAQGSASGPQFTIGIVMLVISGVTASVLAVFQRNPRDAVDHQR